MSGSAHRGRHADRVRGGYRMRIMLVESAASIAAAIGRELSKSKVEHQTVPSFDAAAAGELSELDGEYDGIVIGNVPDQLVQVAALRQAGVTCAILCLLDCRDSM